MIIKPRNHLKNEVGFVAQRSRLQVPTKQASLAIETIFIFYPNFPLFRYCLQVGFLHFLNQNVCKTRL